MCSFSSVPFLARAGVMFRIDSWNVMRRVWFVWCHRMWQFPCEYMLCCCCCLIFHDFWVSFPELVCLFNQWPPAAITECTTTRVVRTTALHWWVKLRVFHSLMKYGGCVCARVISAKSTTSGSDLAWWNRPNPPGGVPHAQTDSHTTHAHMCAHTQT